MDLKKNKMCRMFAILLLSLYLRSGTTTNIDCDNKPFYCVNVTHFMICVDLGAGVSKTVDDFVIQCPPNTVCYENNRFECEYQSPTTTKSNISKDFTIDTKTTTIFPYEVTNIRANTNTVNRLPKTSVTPLFNEYYNTTDVSTYANYVPDMKTHKNSEISESMNVFTNVIPSTSKDYSIYLKAMTETSPIENLQSVSYGLNSQNFSDKLFQRSSILSIFTTSEHGNSERSSTRNTKYHITNITDISNSTFLNDDYPFIKSIDTLYDSTTDTARNITSTSMDQNAKTTKRKLNGQARRSEAIFMVTETLPLNFPTTYSTLFTPHAEVKGNHNFKNKSPGNESTKTAPKLNKLGQGVQEILTEKSLTYLNKDSDNNLRTAVEDISEMKVLKDTEISSFNGALPVLEIANKIEFTTEFYVKEQLSQIKDIDVTSLYETNISNVTDNYKFVDLPFALESTVIPIEHLAETKQVIPMPTKSNYNNETVMFPEVNQRDRIKLENHFPISLLSKSDIDKISMTSSDYKLSSPNLRTGPEATLVEEKNQQVVTEEILISPLTNDINTFSPMGDLLEITPTIVTDAYPITTALINLKGQKTKKDEANISPLYGQRMSEVTVLGNIFSIHTNTSNLSVTTTSHTKNYATTLSLLNVLDPPVATTEHLTTSNNDAENNKMPQYGNIRQSFSRPENITTVLNSLPSSYNIPDFITFSAIGMNITVIPQFNATKEGMKVTVTESSPVSQITEYHKLPSQEENTGSTTNSILTEDQNIYNLFLGIDNRISKSEFTLKKKMIQNQKVNVSSTHEQYTSDATLSEDVLLINLPDNSNFMLLNYDLTTLSSLPTFKEVDIEKVTDRKEITKSLTAVPHNNATKNEMFILQYEKARSMSLEAPHTSTLLNLTPPEYYFSDINKSAIIDITPGQYTSTSTGKVVSNTKIIENTSTEPELITMALSKNISELKTTEKGILNELQLLNDELNTNKSLSRDKQNTRFSWLNVSLTTTENYIASKKNPVQLNLVTVDAVPDHKNSVEITTDMTKTSASVNNYEIVLANMQHKSQEKIKTVDEMLMQEKMLKRLTPHKSCENTKEVYTDKIPEMANINKYPIQNQESLNDAFRLTSQDESFQVTETSPLKGYVRNTEAHPINNAFAPRFSTYNQSTTDVFTKENFILGRTETASDVVINPENNDLKNKNMHVRSNKDESFIDSIGFTDIVIKDTAPANVANNLINKHYNAESVNLTKDYNHKNSSIKSNYTVNDIATNILTPTSGSNINLLDTKQNSNNVNMKNYQFDTLDKDHISNKQLGFLKTEKPIYDTSSVSGTYNSIIGLTTDNNAKTLHDLEVALGSSTSTIGEDKPYYSQIVTEGASGLYPEGNSVNYIVNIQNSTQSIANTSHSNITKTSFRYLGSVTTRPLPEPPVPVFMKHFKKDSLYAKLNQTIQKGSLSSRSTRGGNYKSDSFDYNKKIDKTPIVFSGVNRIFFLKTNLMKTELRNKDIFRVKANESSAITALFRCNNRSRGRFADSNNCSKYYICISKNKRIVGQCPNNTVFSEIKKRCTKNLSHCIRNNQFRCIQDGRFSDMLRRNIYYICVNNNNAYIRFQFQCQNGFYLNKTSVRCVKNIGFQSQMFSVSIDNDNSNKGSDQSTIEYKSREKKQAKDNASFICKQEGKFPDAEDCRRYYVCSKNSKSVYRRRTRKCDSDEVFHREKKKCVDRDSYECN